MPETMTFDRITIEPDKMGGVPCIRGLRIPAETVARMLDEGITADEVLDAYPDLETDDIDQAVAWWRSHPAAHAPTNPI
jgi:uncharacterized protein (DUF433 family)